MSKNLYSPKQPIYFALQSCFSDNIAFAVVSVKESDQQFRKALVNAIEDELDCLVDSVQYKGIEDGEYGRPISVFAETDEGDFDITMQRTWLY